MTTRQHLLTAIGLLVVIVGIGGTLVVWPAYRESMLINEQVRDLHRRSRDYQAQADVLARLAMELDEVNRRLESGFRTIPEMPDIAGLMRVLSLPVDGTHVRDQTFTAGEPWEALDDGEMPVMVQPLTIDMVARFDSVFMLLRAAESMDRLLRVASVNIAVPGRHEGEVPFATASVVVEAVYEPSMGD